MEILFHDRGVNNLMVTCKKYFFIILQVVWWCGCLVKIRQSGSLSVLAGTRQCCSAVLCLQTDSSTQHTSTRHHPYQHAAFKTCLLFQASVHVLLTGDCPLYWNQKQTLVHVRYYLSVTLIQYKFIDKYIFELDSRNPPNLFVYWITESLL